MLRARSPRRSVYLGAWFNSLRTSYAMALYARRTGDTKLLELAQQTLNLALKAPGPNGAFKCFAVPGETPDQVFWGAGDGAVVSVSSGYLGFDMSWTGFWMLKWREAGLPGAGAILARCTRLADFLISRQRADGWLPTRFDESGAVDENSAIYVPAETAPCLERRREALRLVLGPTSSRFGQGRLSGKQCGGRASHRAHLR